MIELLVICAVGAAVAGLIAVGLFKGLKMLVVIGAILAMCVIAYMFLWPGAGMQRSANKSIFRGPIIIRIVPPAEDDTEIKEQDHKLQEDQTAKEYFTGASVRDPFELRSH